MQKITSIQPQQKKGRFNIYLDNQYSFAVGENTLVSFRLSKGLELSDSLIKEIKLAESKNKVYSKALDYLSYQMRTIEEVRTYLQSKKIEEELIESTLLKLQEIRLLDDLIYAKSYVKTMVNTSNKGPRIISDNLLKKGVSKDIIATCLAEFNDELQIENAKKLAQKLAKRYQKNAFNNLKLKIKTGLYAKGFSNDIITTVLDNMNLEKDLKTELNALNIQGEKMLKRYSRFEPKIRNQKVKSTLFRKGFSLDEISEFLDTLQDKEK